MLGPVSGRAAAQRARRPADHFVDRNGVPVRGLATALVVAAATLGAAALAAWLTWPDFAPDRRAEAARLMGELMSGKHPVGGDFELLDSGGRRVALADFRGRLVLLYFGYTYCPDVCPTDLAAIAQALRELGPAAEAVHPLFVTLDPQRDTPAVLREYAAAFSPQFLALTGTPEEIRRVAAAYKVFFEKVPSPGSRTYLIDHTAYTFLLGRDGRFVSLFPPGTPAARIVSLLREQI